MIVDVFNWGDAARTPPDRRRFVNRPRLFAGIAAGLCVLSGHGAQAGETWIPAWYASPATSANPSAAIKDLTLREIVRVTSGGTSVRIKLSNAYGKASVHIDDACIADRQSGSATTNTVRLSFQGAGDVTIAPGADVTSD